MNLARSGAEFETPVAWAALGSWAHRAPGGASLEPRFAEVAEGPLAAWLEERM